MAKCELYLAVVVVVCEPNIYVNFGSFQAFSESGDYSMSA